MASQTLTLDGAIGEFMSRYFAAHGRSEKTVAAYRRDLTDFGDFAGGGTRLGRLGGETVAAWVAHLRGNGYAPASVTRKAATLRVFCSFWVGEGRLSGARFRSPAARPEVARGEVLGFFASAVRGKVGAGEA